MEFFYFTRPCMSPRGELTRLADRRGATIAARKTVGKARGVPAHTPHTRHPIGEQIELLAHDFAPSANATQPSSRIAWQMSEARRLFLYAMVVEQEQSTGSRLPWRLRSRGALKPPGLRLRNSATVVTV